MKKPQKIIGFLAIMLCCLAWLIGVMIAGSDNADFTGWMLILLYAVGIWAVYKCNVGRIYPFLIFLLYCFGSNAGQTLAHLLGMENTAKVDIYASYSNGLINEMLLLQGVFILFMILGYLLLRKMRTEVSAQDQPMLKEEASSVTVGLEELVLWMLSLYVAIIYVQELVQRTNMDYGEYYYEARQGLGTVAQYLYHVVIFAYLFKHTGWKRKMAFGIILVLSTMSVFIGARSATIPAVVGVCFILSYQARKKIKLRLRYVVLGVLVLWVFAAFEDLRQYPISQLSFSLIAEKLALTPATAMAKILQEMGGSARTTLSTMIALDKSVIEHEGTILYSLLKGVFPIQLLNLVGITPPAITSLSAWVSDYGSGPYMDGRGWGYSFIGEIIYNFGNWGFVFSFFFGMLLAWLENCIEKLLSNKDYYLSAGILYVLGYGVFLARAETALLATRIRYTVYMAVLIVLIRGFIKNRSVKIR